jgi:hypothetical protein
MVLTIADHVARYRYAVEAEITDGERNTFLGYHRGATNPADAPHDLTNASPRTMTDDDLI